MSWSCGTNKVRKQVIEGEIDAVMPLGDLEGAAFDQIQAAKRAAKELVKTIPGPLMVVSMSGHANGMGWNKKEGWSDDFITVTVGQYNE